jgi:DNA end-binding protein Ku
MPRSFWKGAISFGLVNIRVRLYPATRHLDVRFRELDSGTGQRLRHQRVRPGWPESPLPPALTPAEEGRREPPEPPEPPADRGPLRRPPGPPPVESAPQRYPPPFQAVLSGDVVKGFEIEPNRYVTVSEAELESLAPERSRSIDIEQFVAARELDPIHFDTSYYVVPEVDHVRSFAVLLEGMRQTDRLGLSWIVLRRKRHLAALRAYQGLMVLTTLFHADEVLPWTALAPPLPLDLSQREREMAKLLIETLSGPFEPERYRDEYRERLLGLLEERGGSAATVAQAPEELIPATGIEELMAALQASVDRAKQQKSQKPRRRRKGA